MELNTCKQIEFDSIDEIDIDVVICASGYESRCTAVAQSMNLSKASKYALAFDNHISSSQRNTNNKIFIKLGYKVIISKGDNHIAIKALMDEICLSVKKDTITILVDYSSMTRVWYAYILLFFSNLDGIYKKAKILFTYSFSQFTPSQSTETYNKIVGPIYGFCNFAIPDKPTALIIGLGYEKIRAFGLSEYLDAETFLFYTASEENNNLFTQEVEQKNSDILFNTKKDNIIKYPISDLDTTVNLLYTMCTDLEPDYRIVVAPCGPKPFTLISLITAIKIKNIDVWRISSGSEGNIYNRVSSGKVSVLKCTFKS